MKIHSVSSAILGFFLSALVSSALRAEPTPIGPISFSGGLNLTSLSTLIPDQDSPDLCNCSPEVIGAMSKRNGSKRYVTQAISSNAITSLQRVYSSTGSGQNFKATFGTSGDKIFMSTDDVKPQWIILSSNNAPGQHYSYVTMNGRVLITGDGLTENVRQYNIAASSAFVLREAFAVDAASSGIVPRGKYQLVANNYYLLANVVISTEPRHLPQSTTYYASRILYSRFNNFSSMTAQRSIDFNQNDGSEITGMGTLTGGSALPGGDFRTVVDVFKPSSIGELSFTVLDLPTPNLGGDWVFSETIHGVGVIAPRTLSTTQRGYIFMDKTGILLWNKSTFTSLSQKIKPLLDELIRSGKYRNAVGFYYPKKDWYVLSIEHPKRLPREKNNYTLVYDFATGEWFPFCGWLADSFAVADNVGDSNVYYGDSADGYVHEFDLETRPDDSRKEIVFDTMDSSYTWAGSSHDIVNVREGTASLKIAIYDVPATGFAATSMTRMGLFPMGEWYDKTRATIADKISFKAFAHNVTSITSLRVDLEVRNNASAFDSNFTSVTISSASFAGNRVWTTFEIALSSFPERPDWTDLSIETVPFYSRFNSYGIRFVVTGVDISSVSIDDLRFVGQRDSPVKMYRFTKLFDFQSPAYKGFKTILLTMDKSPDASFAMDIYNDFGQSIRTEKIGAAIPKEILTFRQGNIPGLAILDSLDFSVKRQTQTHTGHWDCVDGVMDEKTILCGDRENDRLISFKRTDFSTFSLTFGSFGSQTTNFNLIHSIAQFPNGYLISDLTNQRIKVHSTKNLGFLKQYGQLGNGATNFHQPTGVAADSSHYFVSDESNDRIVKMDQSTFGIVAQIAVDHNAIADSSLVAGDKNLFMLYNSFSSQESDTLNLVLEKRDKANLDLLQRVQIYPQNVSTGSYRMQGTIGLLGRYVFIAFGNEAGQSNPVYYIQKRLQSNLEVVAEYATDRQFFTASGYSLSFNPITKTEQKDLKVEGRYVQLKFYDDDLDNFWRLYQMTPMANIQNLTY